MNAILSCLGNHKNIGIHTEMFSDGILPLVKKGVINGSNKKLDRGKIVPALDLGSGAVTTRNHIHWFITEYGAVNLYGRSLQERAKLIISVAHPQFQEMLDEAAFKRFGPHYHYICRNS